MIEVRVHFTDDPPHTSDWGVRSATNDYSEAIERLLDCPHFDSMTLHGNRGVSFEYRLVRV